MRRRSHERERRGDRERRDADHAKAKTLLALPEKLRQAQATFDRTGGLHAAGLFTTSGELLVAREDVGRHNAVDKVLGWGFLNAKLPFDHHVLLVSGRSSFEIMQKALAARVPIVAAVSAPSSLAVQFALEDSRIPGAWLVLTDWNPEGTPDANGKPSNAPRCHGVALAVTVEAPVLVAAAVTVAAPPLPPALAEEPLPPPPVPPLPDAVAFTTSPPTVAVL